MRKFTIFGNPVAHSKSPDMHNNAFLQFGVLAEYNKTELKSGNELKTAFLDGGFSGANVTVPFKEDAFRIADKIEGIANKIKAVNTLIKKDNKIIAYNTDAYGFVKSIENFDIKNALILGAGGTAKAISFGLKEAKIKCSIANRSKQRLLFFKNHNFTTYLYDTIDVFNFDIIINTTSSGLAGKLPCDKELLISLFKYSKYSADVVYGKNIPFLNLAKKYSQITKDGTDMLINQAVLAFLYFTDFKFKEEDIYRYLKEGFYK